MDVLKAKITVSPSKGKNDRSSMIPRGRANLTGQQVTWQPQTKEKNSNQVPLSKQGNHNARQSLLYTIIIQSLRKHAYSNIEKISLPKTEIFQIKISDIFHISAQNIDCWYSLEPPRRGGSNEYPQFMFLSRNKKNNVYLRKPQFYYIKVGFKGVNII